MTRTEIIEEIRGFKDNNTISKDLYVMTNKIITTYIFRHYRMPRMNLFMEDIYSETWLLLTKAFDKFESLDVTWSTFIILYVKKIMWHDFYNMANHISAPVGTRRIMLDYISEVTNGDKSEDQFTEEFLAGKYPGYSTKRSLSAMIALTVSQPCTVSSQTDEDDNPVDLFIYNTTSNGSPEVRIIKNMLVNDICTELTKMFKTDRVKSMLCEYRLIPILFKNKELMSMKDIAARLNRTQAALYAQLKTLTNIINNDVSVRRLLDQYNTL